MKKNLTLLLLLLLCGHSTNALNLSLKNFAQDGESYTNSINGPNDDCFIYFTDGLDGVNTIECDVKWSDATGEYGKIAFQMIDAAGATLCYEIYNDWDGDGKTRALLRYPGNAGIIAEVYLDNITQVDFVHLRMSYDTDYIYFSVDDNIIYSGENTYGTTLWRTNNNSYLYTIGEKSEYKNITASNQASPEEKPQNPDILYSLSNFTETTDDDGTIYSNTLNGANDDCFIYINGGINNYNTINYDVKWSDITGSYAKNCLQMKDLSGNTMCFEIYTAWESTPAVAIFRYPGKVSGNIARVELPESITGEEWTHVRITVSDSDIYFTVGNTEVFRGQNTYGSSVWLADNKTYLYTIGEKSSYKNINLTSEEEIPSPPSDWTFDNNWTSSDESGETIHSAQNSAVCWYTGADISTYNTIEAEVRYYEPSRGDGGINLQVNFDGGIYLLNLAPNTNPVNPVIRIYDKASTGNDYLSRTEIKTGFGNTELGDWVKLKMIVDKQALVCYVNDIVVYNKFIFATEDFVWQKAGVNTFLCNADVKNIKFSHSDIDLGSLGFIDLEFNDAKGVNVMNIENGTIAYADGCLNATIASDDMTIGTPVIQVAAGHKYSMLMPLRNTFLVRMANKSKSSSVVVKFRTSDGGDTWYEKRFDIIPDSDFTTYYFNVSDINASGYVKELKLTFEGGDTGMISVNAITFEREEPIYNYAGNITSCIADIATSTVTVIGNVSEELDGQSVTIWKTDPRNYSESLSHSSVEELTTTTVSGGTFTASFPLYEESCNHSLLSNTFLASIGDTKVAPEFVIENYRDFNDDAPRFEVPINITIDVTDTAYGAKGDGFTDDTEAFQKAIDAVEAAGGGKIIVPGDNSQYGRRYIITHIELCSNLEFVIEKGAVLWQSQREDELNKTVPVNQRGFDSVVYSHDVSIDGLVWCTSYSTIHLPMILTRNKENVRICGGGTIRMNDTGNQMEDPFYFVGDTGLAIGQESRVKQIPFCFYSSNHIDLTDITMMRSNCWHCYMSFNNDVYIGNVREKQAVNVTADGFTITSCKNVIIDRCMTYTSDDAVGICTAYEDGRGQFYRPTKPGEDNATENVTIRHSFLFGGFGISWMPWGAAASNAEYQETRNINIFDCALGGHKSSGTWPDDPFYGWSALSSYTQTEDKNYCAIKDVRFYDNKYLANFDLTLNNIRLWATNWLVLDPITGTTNASSIFLNGNFDKEVHKGNGFNDETNYTTGLCYWSNELSDNGTVGTILKGTKTALTVDTGEEITQPDYAGFISGNGRLFQGLYLGIGDYNLSMSLKPTGGKTYIYMQNLVTGEETYRYLVENSDAFTSRTFNISISTRGTYALGIIHEGEETEIAYIDDVHIEEIATEDKYTVEGDIVIYRFETPEDAYTVYSDLTESVKEYDGALIAENDDEHKIMFESTTPLQEFMVSVDINIADMPAGINAGIYLLGENAQNDNDKIDAFNVQIEKSGDQYIPRLFRFDSSDGYMGALASGAAFTASENINLKAIVKNATLYVFIDNAITPTISYDLKPGLKGDVGLRSQYMKSVFDNFTIQSTQYQKKGSSDIADTLKSPTEEIIYDLKGNRIPKIRQQGIYIVNGEKKLIK